MNVEFANELATELRQKLNARTVLDVAQSGSTILAELGPGLRVQVFEQGGKIVLTPDHPELVAHMEHNERLPKAKCLVDIQSVIKTMVVFQNKLETFVLEMEKRTENKARSGLKQRANVALMMEESGGILSKTRDDTLYGDGANWSCRAEVQPHLVQIDFTCSPVKAALFARWLGGL